MPDAACKPARAYVEKVAIGSQEMSKSSILRHFQSAYIRTEPACIVTRWGEENYG